MARGTRKAEVQVGARSERLNAELRRAQKKFEKFGRASARSIKRSFSGVGRSLATLGGIGAGIGFVEMGVQVRDFEKRLVRLQIQSGSNASSMDQLREETRKLSDQTGVAAEDILGGVEKYVSLTGSVDDAKASMMTFAKVAMASGASMDDISSTAAALSQNMEIKPEQMEKAFDILLQQGKMGAVELRELSSLMATVSSQFPDFGNKGIDGLSELGASLQLVRAGFGSGSEAVTGFMGMMTAFSKKADGLRKAGVEVLRPPDADGVRRMRKVSDIVADLAGSKLAKNESLLVKALGRAEGKRAFAMLQKGNKVLEDGSTAFDKLAQAGRDAKVVSEDYDAYQASAAGKIDRAMQRVKNTIARVFTPERIEKFAEAMGDVADAIAWVADHLKLVGGALLALKLGPGLMQLVGLVGNLKGAGGLAGLVGKGSIGGGGAGMGLLAAGVGGVMTGMALDEKYEISDRADPDYRAKKRAEFSDNASVANQLRYQANELQKQVDLKRKFVSISNDGLFAKAQYAGSTAQKAALAAGGSAQDKLVKFAPGEMEQFARKVEQLRSQARVADYQQQHGMEINIFVDERSLLKAEEKKARETRSQER